MNNIYFYLPNLKTGGAEKVASQLSFSIDNYNPNFILNEDNIQLEFNGNVNVIKKPSKSKIKIIHKIRKFTDLFFNLRKLKTNMTRNDIVVSFMSLQNILNVITKKDEICIISIRSFESLAKGNTAIYKVLIKKFYPKADVLVSVSKYAGEDLVNNYNVPKDKIKVIYNPLNFEKINRNKLLPIKNNHKSLFDSKTLIYVATLKKGKGHNHLLRIFKKVLINNPGLKLLLLGDGPIKDNLIEDCKNLGLSYFDEYTTSNIESRNVYFLGHIKNPYNYINKASLFIFPSEWEGFPNVIIESMACNTVVISSDCPSGPREIIAPLTNYDFHTKSMEIHDYGVLLPYFKNEDYENEEIYNNKISLWSSSISKLLNDESQIDKILLNCNEYVQKFSSEYITNQWKQLFLELSEKK